MAQTWSESCDMNKNATSTSLSCKCIKVGHKHTWGLTERLRWWQSFQFSGFSSCLCFSAGHEENVCLCFKSWSWSVNCWFQSWWKNNTQKNQVMRLVFPSVVQFLHTRLVFFWKVGMLFFFFPSPTKRDIVDVATDYRFTWTLKETDQQCGVIKICIVCVLVLADSVLN